MGRAARTPGGETRDAHLIVGVVRRPHGVRGELVVSVETDHEEEVFRQGRVLVLGDRDGKPTGRSLRILRTRPFKGARLLVLEGLTDRDQADELRGQTVLIAAAEAAPPAEGEVFLHDLVGLEVMAGDTRVGRVRDVLRLPGGETLVVRRPGARDLLLPFVAEIVREVDLEAGEVRVTPPEGLLEL